MANRGSDDERNPFVAFRRFADEQFSQMVKTMRGLPSAFTEIRKSFDGSEQNAPSPWKSFSDGYERSMNPERRKTEPRRGEEAFWQRQKEKESTPTDQEDDFFWFPFIPFERIESFFPMWHGHRRCGGRQEAWQPELRWARNSPYSPLCLEQDEDFQQSSVNWRDALEDLLEVDQRKSLPDRTSASQASDQSPEDWIANLFTRRLLRPDLPARHRIFDDSFDELVRHRFLEGLSPSPRGKNQHNGRSPGSEFDVFEWVQKEMLNECQHESRQTSTPSSFVEEEPPRQVRSTVTTIEKRNLPDGSRETVKTVKQKFSDGAESMEEERSIQPPEQHTTKEVAPKQVSPPSEQLQQSGTEQDNRQKSQEKQRSWFWSR